MAVLPAKREASFSGVDASVNKLDTDANWAKADKEAASAPTWAAANDDGGGGGATGTGAKEIVGTTTSECEPASIIFFK